MTFHRITSIAIGTSLFAAFGQANTSGFRARRLANVRSIASDEITNPTMPSWVGPDLALGRQVSVSSTYYDWELYDAHHLVDGDSGSRWTSAYSDNQTIEVDLGDSFSIDMVRLRWEAAHAESYELLLSLDGNSWTIVDSMNNSPGGFEEIIFDSQEAQFVRLNLLKRATQYGFSLWDLEVYSAQVESKAILEPSVGLPEPTTTNLAKSLDCIADASTTYKDWGRYNIDHILDGNNETRWASEHHDNQKIYIDLGEPQYIDRIRIGWEDAHPRSYELWLSEDGNDWTMAYSTENCKGGLEDLAFAQSQQILARYIHLNLLTQATEFGFSIWDFGVYAPSVTRQKPAPAAPKCGSVASNRGRGGAAEEAKGCNRRRLGGGSLNPNRKLKGSRN